MKTRKIFKSLLMGLGIAVLFLSVSTAFAVPFTEAGGLASLFGNPTSFLANFNLHHIDFFSAGTGGASYATINMISLGQPDDLLFEEGTENMGGFGAVAYLGLRSHINTYPVENTDHSKIANLAKLVGSYVFNQGRHFIKLDCIPQTVGANGTGQGEYVGSQSFQNKGEFSISGSGADLRGYSRLLNNSYGVLILVNDNGERIAYGTEQRPVSFKATIAEGTKPTDAKLLKVEFTNDSFVPGHIYEGEIPLDGEILPAIS